jgi:ATP-dependent Clp protease adaptor protein ClpS
MSLYSFDADTLVQEDVDLLEELLTHLDIGHQLVVHNDDVNTFDWVIESLIDICNHTVEQATQCSMFIHFQGKYGVKHGSEDALLPMKDALHERGISASIEKCS